MLIFRGALESLSLRIGKALQNPSLINGLVTIINYRPNLEKTFIILGSNPSLHPSKLSFLRKAYLLK